MRQWPRLSLAARDSAGTGNIAYVHLPDAQTASPIAISSMKFGDRQVFPLDLPSWWACEAAGYQCHMPASMAHNAAADKIFRAATEVVTASIFRSDLFSKDFGRINPLYVTAHWIVALLGGVAVKINDLDAIAGEANGCPAVLVESAEKIPFVPIYGSIAKIMFGCDVAWQKKERELTVRQRLARTAMRGKSCFLTLRRRIAGSQRKSKLLLAQNLPDISDLIEANRRLGAPFAIEGFNFGWHYVAPPRQKWVLPSILPELAKDFYRSIELPVPEDTFVTALLSAYEFIGEEFEGCLARAMKPLRRKRQGILLVPALVKMPFRADVYRAWREGLSIVNEVYADGELSGSMALNFELYRLSIAALNLYSGPCGELAREWIRSHNQVPVDCQWKVAAVGAEPTSKKLVGIRASGSRKIMYLPTAFSGNVRLGPQREQHDIPYWLFQLELLSVLTKTEGTEVTYKAHPKNFVKLSAPEIAQVCEYGAHYISDPLTDDMLADTDCLVADHFASGVSQALSKGVAVVIVGPLYRHLFPELQQLAERSIVFVDSETPGWQRRLVQAIAAQLDAERPPCHDDFLVRAIGSDIPGSRADNVLRAISACFGEAD